MSRGYLYVLLCALFFSSMEVALKGITGQFHPIQMTFTRFLVGGLVLLPFGLRSLRRHGASLDARAIGSFALLGFVGIFVSMTFYQIAVDNANASVIAVLFSCNPVFVFALAFLVLRADIRRHHILALVLEVFGAMVLINPLNTDISLAGIVCVALSVVFFALYTVLGAHPCAAYSGTMVTCGSFLMGSLEMLLFILLSHVGPAAAFFAGHGLELFSEIPLLSGYTTANFPVVLYVSIGVTGCGYMFYFLSVEVLSPLSASLAFFFKPILAPIFAWIILSEPIPLNMIVGIMIILCGSLVTLLPGLRVSCANRFPFLRKH